MNQHEDKLYEQSMRNWLKENQLVIKQLTGEIRFSKNEIEILRKKIALMKERIKYETGRQRIQRKLYENYLKVKKAKK